VPDADALVGVRVHEVLLVERLTMNGPLSSLTVIVDEAAVPALRLTAVGLAVSVKSRTV